MKNGLSHVKEKGIMIFNGSANFFSESFPQILSYTFYLSVCHFSSVLEKTGNNFTMPTPCIVYLARVRKSCCLLHSISHILIYVWNNIRHFVSVSLQIMKMFYDAFRANRWVWYYMLTTFGGGSWKCCVGKDFVTRSKREKYSL